ncbi:MAG TPA: hypothetical protein VHY22_05545 [Chthoniobacteraceae bacterium]|jgi:hypothetical protein|nr:hypothetical protein [Chthoniobacteraceae bacterium]
MPNFEQACGIDLRKLFPCSVLSNILLFRPDVPDHQRYGYEIDHLIHGFEGNLHRLFIIECKEPPIERNANGWWVQRVEGPKNVREQVWNHSIALLSHLAGTLPPGALRIEACVLGQAAHGHHSEQSPDPRVTFHCFGINDFAQFLVQHAKGIQLVHQSCLLNDLRLGIAVPELGHPEMANAIRFVKRCRTAIDNDLFRLFPDYPNMSYSRLAAINGTAGMGKSVVLAYALFVLASDWYVEHQADTNQTILKSFSQKAKDLEIPPHSKRSICAVAMSAKQIETLENLWKYFVDVFSAMDGGNNIHFNKPIFRQWDGSIPDDCNVLVIDEAHDLNAGAQAIVANWKQEAPDARYLLIACDRHQKLRLLGRNATMMEGLSFSAHTARLRRNYRSPFPVYVAGLALMFRWFAKDGPKVIPGNDDLRDGFGFKVDAPAGENTLRLSNINDSHPGNCWAFTASQFAAAQDAFTLLQKESIRQRDVLWVRFGKEDPSFDYEKLSAFTYHRADQNDSGELLDKYVKGQEFPVVVIEGVPAAMLRVETQENVLGQSPMTEEEREMWRARRELYLCCSRATAFLFFVTGEQDGKVNEELCRLLRSMSRPSDSGRRCWSFDVKFGDVTRTVRDIDRLIDEVPVPVRDAGATQPPVSEVPTEALPRIELVSPVTLKALLQAYGMATGINSQQAVSRVLDALAALKADVMFQSDVLSDELTLRLGMKLGLLVKISGGSQAIVVPESESKKPHPDLFGKRVKEAAEILRVSKKKLLEILPLTFSENSLLERAEDIQRILEKLGDRASAGGGETRVVSAPSVPTDPASEELYQQLLKLVESGSYRASKGVTRYLQNLEVMLRNTPGIRQYLLNFPYERMHFADSEQAILDKHPYASVYRVGTTSVYAMCTLSRQSKIQVLSEILKQCSLSAGQVARIVETL